MAFNGSLSYPDGGHGRRAGGLRESWPLLRRPPSFLSLVFSSAAPLFLKPAPSTSVRVRFRRPVYPGILTFGGEQS